MLELWFLTFAAEGMMYGVPLLWRFRRYIAVLIATLIAVTSVWLWIKLGFMLGSLFGLIAAFRIFNMLRIVKNRMHEKYLKRVTQRSSFQLFMMYPLLVLILSASVYLAKGNYVNLLIFVQLLVAVGVLFVTLRNIRKLRYERPSSYLTDKQLPTVTVAIPARNETSSLQECLRAILANDYPKLEVIVLDDCSQGKTAEIIKSFAHDGVRFVKGQPPADRWLAKNQAYQQLFKESSGEYILFCGVDVRLGPQSIRCMVNLLKSRNKSMLSVLPIRSVSTLADAFIQPMRYWWELALPRRLFNRPPALSTCWMIDSDELTELGGFGSVSHTIIPEGVFARDLVKKNKYSFVRSSNELEVKTVKDFHDQLRTAIRNRYPQIRRRPEWALVMTSVNIILLVLPFGFLVASFWASSIYFPAVAVTCMLLIVTHVSIVNITDPANSLWAMVSFPVAAISEMIIGYISMIKYEFLTIEWKDRNICIPVMHVIPRFPKI